MAFRSFMASLSSSVCFAVISAMSFCSLVICLSFAFADKKVSLRTGSMLSKYHSIQACFPGFFAMCTMLLITMRPPSYHLHDSLTPRLAPVSLLLWIIFPGYSFSSPSHQASVSHSSPSAFACEIFLSMMNFLVQEPFTLIVVTTCTSPACLTMSVLLPIGPTAIFRIINGNPSSLRYPSAFSFLTCFQCLVTG